MIELRKGEEARHPTQNECPGWPREEVTTHTAMGGDWTAEAYVEVHAEYSPWPMDDDELTGFGLALLPRKFQLTPDTLSADTPFATFDAKTGSQVISQFRDCSFPGDDGPREEGERPCDRYALSVVHYYGSQSWFWFVTDTKYVGAKDERVAAAQRICSGESGDFIVTVWRGATVRPPKGKSLHVLVTEDSTLALIDGAHADQDILQVAAELAPLTPPTVPEILEAIQRDIHQAEEHKQRLDRAAFAFSRDPGTNGEVYDS